MSLFLFVTVDQQVGYHEVKPLDPAAQGQGQGVNAGQMQQPAAMDQVGAPRIDNVSWWWPMFYNRKCHPGGH